MNRILIFFVIALSKLPFWFLYLLSDILYYPVYYLVKYRRKVVRRNLTESFPEKDLKEIISIEKEFYHYFVDMVFETIKTYSMSPEQIRRRAEFVNSELINGYTRQGKNVSVYIGHYCNWEWISSSGLWLDKAAEVGQIYHHLKNQAVNEFILKMRSRFGNNNVEMDDTVRYLIRKRRQGQTVSMGIIGDQSPREYVIQYYLDFLNHYVPALVGPEKFTKRFGFVALFLKAERIKRGYYRYTFQLLCQDTAELPDYELTDLYYRDLEKEIRKAPQYYLWTHKRFKFAKPFPEDYPRKNHSANNHSANNQAANNPTPVPLEEEDETGKA